MNEDARGDVCCIERGFARRGQVERVREGESVRGRGRACRAHPEQYAAIRSRRSELSRRARSKQHTHTRQRLPRHGKREQHQRTQDRPTPHHTTPPTVLVDERAEAGVAGEAEGAREERRRVLQPHHQGRRRPNARLPRVRLREGHLWRTGGQGREFSSGCSAGSDSSKHCNQEQQRQAASSVETSRFTACPNTDLERFVHALSVQRQCALQHKHARAAAN